MAEVAPKPPPIRVAVAGIEPAPIVLTPARRDWARLASLPPFQVFARRHAPSGLGDDEVHARQVIAAAHAAGGEAELWDTYCAWHAEQGRWPGETPMGEAKE